MNMIEQVCKTDDLLICVRGATTGSMNWADRQYHIGRCLAALTIDICLPRYVYYFLRMQTERILALADSYMTFPNLQEIKLRKLRIPVPSLSKQCQIVEYLDMSRTRLNSLKEL
jgi:type I restriction enzyme S subunit